MRIIFLSLIVIVLTWSGVEAAVLEFPLPTMTGGFATYQASVPYAGGPAPLLSVKIQATFRVDKIGEWQCAGFPSGYICPRGVSVSGKVWKNQSTDDDYLGSIPDVLQTGTFDETMELGASPGFGDLAHGDVIEIRFSFVPMSEPCDPVECFLGAMPTGALTSVKLLVEVPDPTPVKRTTWGKIKSLFNLQ